MRYSYLNLIFFGVSFFAPSYALAMTAECNFYNDISISRPFKASDELALKSLRVSENAGKVYFVKDGFEDPACPADMSACKKSAYLVAFDQVVITGTSGAYSCATFTSGGKNHKITFGFLPTAALSEFPQTREATDWTGVWSSSIDRTIVISREGDGLLKIAVKSDFADHPVADDPDNPDAPDWVVNLSETGNPFAFSFDPDDDDPIIGDVGADPENELLCRVRMWRLGDYLVLGDNGCNFSITGTAGAVYRRAN